MDVYDSYPASPEHQIPYIRDAWTFFNVCVCVWFGVGGKKWSPLKGRTWGRGCSVALVFPALWGLAEGKGADFLSG